MRSRVAQVRELPGFNPHPASLPGDATAVTVIVGETRVSIRTRHRCRVMRSAPHLQR